MKIRDHTLAATILGAMVVSGPHALAAGSHAGGHDHHGEPGKASAVSRTVNITMHDNYYEPETIEVKAGETIRFKIVNKGAFVHEFNIGTPDMHVAHSDEMQMMVDHGVLEPTRINLEAAKAMQETMGHGMHDEPNSALLEPGKSGEIIWTFPSEGEIEFACNVPGHYDAGMAGMIDLK